MKHGFGHAVKILRDKATSGPPECELFAEQVDGYLQEGISRQHEFICSFSSCGNDLGQWRAYADNGRGYALGFDGKMFEDAFFNEGEARSQEAGYQAFSIRYDDTWLAKIQQQLVERVFPLISLPRGRRDRGDFITELLTSFTTRTLGASMTFKHEAYENEKEYRFLQIHKDAPAAKFRYRPYSLVRYVEFDWRSTGGQALKKIVAGPADEVRALQFANDCLRHFHVRDVETSGSGIPYRAI